MHQVYIGTSGWAYTSWKPDFYPAKLPAKKLLDHYATQLNAVEVNYTFRANPRASTLDAWIAATSADFLFAAKANQRLTHIRRLKPTQEEVKWFFEALRPLADAHRLGPILFQLPPSFKADCETLANFLKLLPRGQLYAFEYRHPSWFEEPILSLLRNENVALCIAESDELVTNEIHTANFAYFRLRKSDYSDADIQQIEQRIKAAAIERDVYAFFKHEETPKGALNALRVRKALS
jgi:uncharacterized protein YecE (DUF72 family)